MKTVNSTNNMAGMSDDTTKPRAQTVTMDLHSFVLSHAGYKFGPLIVACVLAATWRVPAIADFYEARSLEPWGAANAAMYTVFAIWSMFAVHGLVCCYR